MGMVGARKVNGGFYKGTNLYALCDCTDIRRVYRLCR